MKTLLWFVFAIAVAIVAIYAAVVLLFYLTQRQLLYYPQPYQQQQYPSIIVHSGDAVLQVIVLSNSSTERQSHTQISDNQPKPAIIYFGGNAEAVIHSAALFEPLLPVHDVYLVNYRGYGGSSGRITEDNNYRDALAIYDEVAKQHSTVSLVGRSLGSGVATYVTSQRQQHRLAKLLLITPFDSIKAVAQAKFGWLPVRYLLKDSYPSIDRVANIQVPTLLIAAQNDEIIPASHSIKLQQQFQHGVELKSIANSNHNTVMDKPEAQALMYRFFCPQ